MGGTLLGLSLCDLSGNGPLEMPSRFLSLWFLPFPLLFLYGVRKLHEPLWLCVVVSPPVLFSIGLYLVICYPQSGFQWVFSLGFVTPAVAYSLVRSYYASKAKSNSKTHDGGHLDERIQ